MQPTSEDAPGSGQSHHPSPVRSPPSLAPALSPGWWSGRRCADRSWRSAFVKGMFRPTDVTRRAAIIKDPGIAPGIAAAVLRAAGEFDGAATLADANVPVLSSMPLPRFRCRRRHDRDDAAGHWPPTTNPQVTCG